MPVKTAPTIEELRGIRDSLDRIVVDLRKTRKKLETSRRPIAERRPS